MRWVDPERYHITLRFMGDVAAPLVPRLATAVEAIGAEPAFPARLTGTGTFPSHGTPRVYWVGVRADPMTCLRGRLDVALTSAGVPQDGGRFAPHLTIGRVKRERRDAPGHVKWGTEAPVQTAEVSSDFVVRAVHLVRSELFRTGPAYANIHKVMLSTGEEARSDR